MEVLNLEKVNLNNSYSRKEVHEFLESYNLKLDDDVDYTIVIRDSKGNIKATSSKAKSVFKCFAVSEELRGEGITSTLITNLVDKLFQEGKNHSFIFTKPDKISIFKSLNFKLIYEVKRAALLEYGMYDINKALDNMAKKYSINKDVPKAAIVMNCNPFTLGHKYLIEEASKSCSEVIVFIVEEDKSLFPFDVRYELVKKGTAHLKNVTVIPGGEYIISGATFPTYFLREENLRHRAFSELDAGIFGKYFCSKFNIVKRIVGEEPYCNSTNTYNESLSNILPQYGVELCQIERKKSENKFISASNVRELLKNDKTDEVKKLLPEVTIEFINSNRGIEIVNRIKESNSLH